MSTQEFEALPLHDALLTSIEVLWVQRLCRLRLSVFAQAGTVAVPHLLEFHNVSLVTVPRNNPWGPSSSVNSSSHYAGVFQLQMQSGDNIEVVAGGFSIIAL